VLATISSVYDVIRQKELVRLNEESAVRLRAHAEAAKAKEKIGLATQIDTYRAGIQQKQAEDSLNTAREAYRDALDNLKILLALPLEEEIKVEAPIPGIAILPEGFRGGKKRKPRIADVVWQGQPLVYLPDISEMVVKTQIREIDLHKVCPGKPTVVLVDAYPDLRLSGRVKSVGVLAESRAEAGMGDKYFQVMVSVKKGDERLRPGMTARVEIECAKVEDAVSVPVHAVFHEKGRTYCYVDADASYEKREVSIGAQSEDWAQVLTGLSMSDRVALSRPPHGEILGITALSRQEE
jgi:HlyD family secretion protein